MGIKINWRNPMYLGRHWMGTCEYFGSFDVFCYFGEDVFTRQKQAGYLRLAIKIVQSCLRENIKKWRRLSWHEIFGIQQTTDWIEFNRRVPGAMFDSGKVALVEPLFCCLERLKPTSDGWIKLGQGPRGYSPATKRGEPARCDLFRIGDWPSWRPDEQIPDSGAETKRCQGRWGGLSWFSWFDHIAVIDVEHVFIGIPGQQHYDKT